MHLPYEHSTVCLGGMIKARIEESLNGVVPALRAAGVADKSIDEMTREVPARLLDLG